MFEGRHIDYRSSKVDTSITDLRRSTHRSSVFEGQHIHLRRSTHQSSKVDTSISEGRHIVTSIFEGRHIDLRRETYRSSKGDTSIFESRRIDLRRSKAETSHLQFVVEYCPQLCSLTAQTMGPWKTACDSLAQTRETAQIYGLLILIAPPTNAHTQYK